MKRRIAFCLTALAVSLVFAIVWAMLVSPGTALAKKPGDKGGGETDTRLARIALTSGSRILWDGLASCPDATRPEDPVWDYWDQFDTPLWEQCEDVVLEDGIETSVSGGGRLFFYTIGRSGVLPVQPDRWLTLNFGPPFDSGEEPFDLDGDQDGDGIPDGPNIDQKVYPGTFYPPIINPDTFVDNVKGTIDLDNMFKKKATRQPLDLTIRVFNPDGGGWPPAGWSLHSIDDLYITVDPVDKDVRTLQTANPNDFTGETDADLFELWRDGVTVGKYRIPLKWTMRIVSAPEQ